MTENENNNVNVGINDNDNDADAVNEVNVNVNVGMEDDDNGNGGSQGKVTICHDGNTLEVAPQALPAHYGHGDTLGPCDDDTSEINTVSVPVDTEEVDTVPTEDYSDGGLIEPD